jgi:hypothetical protein
MKLHQLKEFVKQTIREEQDYQQLFKHMLDKTGKSIADMSDDDKKKFFNAVDTAYKAKSEGRLRGYNEAELTAGQKKIDVDKDGEIEGSDLAALRAGKTNEANEEIKVGQMVKVDNPHWEAALGKKGPFRRKVKMIDHDNVFFTDGSNSSMKYIKESVNEAGNDGFNWPPVLDKFNTKEIQKLEVEYRASLDKSSAILKKQWELINKGYPSDFPWENYDKWPAKLKAEVAKLTQELEKSRAKQPEMFKKLMQARGTWR